MKQAFLILVGVIVLVLIVGGILAWQYFKVPREEIAPPLPESPERPELPKRPAPGKFCLQVITYAISPEGICQQFPSTCDVPKGWRIVKECP